MKLHILLLGMFIGLLISSFAYDYRYGLALSQAVGRIYELGCIQGVLLTKPDPYAQADHFDNCKVLGLEYQQTFDTPMTSK